MKQNKIIPTLLAIAFIVIAWQVIALSIGFLRLEYDIEEAQPLLSRVSFVTAPNIFSNAIEELLEFNLSPDNAYDEVTFITEMGVSGTQWSDGQVRWGHTYDDDDATPQEGKKIELDLWVDQCIEIMINPSQKILNEIKKGYNLKENLELIKSGDEKATNNFWKNCNPATKDDVKLTLEILHYATNGKDGNALFICSNPLKRASTEQILILEDITLILENNNVSNEFDRSERQEILEAHASYANKELEERWLKLCEKSYNNIGLEFLQTIHEGHLTNALTKINKKSDSTIDFYKKIVSQVESKNNKMENYTCFISYLSILKTLDIK